MQRFDALRDAVAAVAAHLGELDWRYDEKEGIALIRMLGKCGPTFATVVEATEEQERLRREISENTAHLEDAIRLAIGRPHEPAIAEAVVARVRALRPLIHRAQRLFTWPPPETD